MAYSWEGLIEECFLMQRWVSEVFFTPKGNKMHKLSIIVFGENRLVFRDSLAANFLSSYPKWFISPVYLL